MLGADLHALTASFTFVSVNYRNTVLHVYGAKLTHRHAASESETSLVTGLGTAVGDETQHPAILDSVIFIIRSDIIAGAVAGYKSNLSHSLSCFRTHNGCDLGSNGSTTHGTLVNRSLAFYYGRSKTCTAGITAAATIVTGKRL